MRKYIVLLLLILIAPFTLTAQSPEGRKPATVVADVMAQMPADNVSIFNRMMQDMVEAGSPAIALLCDKIADPGPTDDTKATFALGGLAYYVTTPGMEAQRNMVSKCLIEAYNKASNKDKKAFFIRMMQITAGGEVESLLAQEVKKEENCGAVVSALTYINTDNTRKTLSSLISATDSTIPCKLSAAKAVGDLSLTECQATLLGWLPTADEPLKKVIIYSLSRMGSSNAIPALEAEAAKAGFKFDPSGALEGYLILLSRSKEAGLKPATKLLKSADCNVRRGAMAAIIQIEGAGAKSKVLKAMDDKSSVYRSAVLDSYTPYADQPFCVELLSKASKQSSAVATDIVNFLTENNPTPYVSMILPMASSTDKALRVASLNALTKSNSIEALEFLLGALKTTDNEKVAEAASSLRWFKANINTALLQTLPKASAEGKTAILDLLSERRATEASKVAIAFCNTDEKSIRDAAFNSLKNVTTEADIPTLCKMLEADNCLNPQAIEDALKAIFASMEPSKALAAINNQIDKAAENKKAPYYAMLSSAGTPSALAKVNEGLLSSNPAIQKASTEAAINWSNNSALDVIFDIYNTNKSGKRAEALTSYINLVNKSTATPEVKFIKLRRAIDVAKTDSERNALLAAIGNQRTFNALILAGKYLNNSATEQAAGSAIMAIALADKDYTFWSNEVKDILVKFVEVRKGGDATYDKAGVQKYINEAPKEARFVAIFNGTDLSGWKGLVSNPIARAKMAPAALQAAQTKANEGAKQSWVVDKDGLLVFTGSGDNLCTEKKYGDFEMYVDWMITPEGDAGIYLRGAPQVQMWDTSRVSVGAEVGSGGLYNNTKHQSKPQVLADNAIGEWNTFYIKMVGERVTVVLNGQKVVDNVIMENYWDRALPIFAEEQIELQAHGTYVAYRDIYVKELPKVEPYTLTAQEAKEGYKILFDGTSMNQWQGNTTDYVTENGTIALYPGNGGGGNLYTTKEYDDFVLRFDFQLTAGANNGLGIRTPLSGDAAYVGTELQILDNEDPVYKDLEVYQYHGSAYGILAAKRGFLKPTGQWNEQEVYLKGSKIKVILNGEVILDGDLAEASKNGTADGKEHPGLKNKTGYIGFLGHGSPVKFRNIRIKEL